MENIKITIITVCYNCKDILEETILSVINQTYNNIEYIIIDGGSTDGTVDIIKKYEKKITHWVSEPDHGIFDAMNKGIMFSSGDYLNFMNAGDKFVSEDVLTSLVDNINNSPIIIYGDWYVKIQNEVTIRKPLSEKYINSKLPFCHQATFIQSEYHKLNKYDSNLRLAADYKFIYQALLRDKVKTQYIPILIASFDATSGASTDNYIEGLNEKIQIWNIKPYSWKWIYWELAKIRMHLSYKLKSVLPATVTIKIKKILDGVRSHTR